VTSRTQKEIKRFAFDWGLGVEVVTHFVDRINTCQELDEDVATAGNVPHAATEQHPGLQLIAQRVRVLEDQLEAMSKHALDHESVLKDYAAKAEEFWRTNAARRAQTETPSVGGLKKFRNHLRNWVLDDEVDELFKVLYDSAEVVWNE